MKNSDVIIIAPDGEGGRNINANQLSSITKSPPIGVPNLGVKKKRVRTYSEEVILTSHSLTINLTPEPDCLLTNCSNLSFGSSSGDIRDDRSDIDGFLSGITSNDTNWADKRPISRR